MIYDYRKNKVTLHAPDRRFLAGAMGLLAGLNKVDETQDTRDALRALLAVMGKYGVKGDEHLKRNEKEGGDVK